MILNDTQHIILIGFKHVGKSSLGKQLAKNLGRSFVDSDEAIEHAYEKQYDQVLSCRDIVKQAGEDFFRALEQAILLDILQCPPAVLALGGGACLNSYNQKQLQPHVVVHVTAEPALVFDRIMKKGVPAFFPEDVDPKQYFEEVWEMNEPIYQKLATISVANNDSLDRAVAEAQSCLIV